MSFINDVKSYFKLKPTIQVILTFGGYLALLFTNSILWAIPLCAGLGWIMFDRYREVANPTKYLKNPKK